MVLLALLVARIGNGARAEAQVAADLRGGAAAEAWADGAVNATLFHLLAVGDQRWAAEGEHRVAVPGGAVPVRIETLSGRVNLNTAPPELLRALLDVVGVQPEPAEALIAAILDWRNPSQRPLPGGAKAAEYVAAGRDYGPPGTPFQSVDELGDVLGMTPSLLRTLRPHLTVWGDGPPDPRYADAVVLAALRELGRGEAASGGTGSDGLVVAITASASGPGGSQFTRRATVALAPDPHGKPWRVLAWSPP
jgi:general secretion pathway protein K